MSRRNSDFTKVFSIGSITEKHLKIAVSAVFGAVWDTKKGRWPAVMWCAVHVKDGDEIRTESFVKAFLPKELDVRCIHLTRSRRKKYGGQWQTVQEKLLPGYVFIATDQPEAVHRELKKAPKPRLLFSDDSHVAILEAHEAALIEALSDERGEIGISKVRVADDGSIEFLSGPLLQVENLVRKVNLHRREAELEAEFMGERQTLYLGIEIVCGT